MMKKVSEQQNSNEKHHFTKSEWLVRIFLYSCVMLTVVKLLYPSNNGYNKSSEARTYIGSINRAQQAYYLENYRFADFDSFDELGLGIRTETDYYHYRIISPMMPVQTWDDSKYMANFKEGVLAIAQAKEPEFRQYIGAVFLFKTSEHREPITAIICEVNAGVPLPSTLPTLIDNEIQCPKGTKPLR